MANPVMVDCPANQWQLVLENATSGVIHIKNTSPSAYYHSFRTTGEPVPVDDTDAIPFRGNDAQLSVKDFVDVYVKAVGADGKVRVDSS